MRSRAGLAGAQSVSVMAWPLWGEFQGVWIVPEPRVVRGDVGADVLVEREASALGLVPDALVERLRARAPVEAALLGDVVATVGALHAAPPAGNSRPCASSASMRRTAMSK